MVDPNFSGPIIVAQNTTPTLPGAGYGLIYVDTNGILNVTTSTGNRSTIGGSTGATDNAILRADGTGGATAQGSGVTISDNSEVLIVSGATSAKPLCVRAAASQTGNLQEWQDSAGAILSFIASSGAWNIQSAGSRRLSVGMTGNIARIDSTVGIPATRLELAASVLRLMTTTTDGVEFASGSGVIMSRVSLNGFQVTISGNTNGSLTLEVPNSQNGNQGGNAIDIKGQNALASSTNVLHGGSINITAGNGASLSSDNAYGGDVNITPGIGYGTGRQGLVRLENIPTSDPVMAGALWNDSGTLKISAG